MKTKASKNAYATIAHFAQKKRKEIQEPLKSSEVYRVTNKGIAKKEIRDTEQKYEVRISIEKFHYHSRLMTSSQSVRYLV